VKTVRLALCSYFR